MKKITLFLCTAMFSALAFSQTTIPCPSSFKRSNGGGGGCSVGKLTLLYEVCPAAALTIDSVYSDGVKLISTFQAGIIDCDGPKYEVTYCINGINIPPTNTLTIFFQGNASYNGSTCTIPSSGGPLPVVISSFNAVRKGNSVLVEWQTTTEINAKDFFLQKKTSNGFVNVAVIPAENKANGASYSFTDNNPTKAITEYRLQMNDQDGQFKVSAIRPVKGIGSGIEIVVYPNPSTGTATILMQDGLQKGQLVVMDNAGRIVKSQTVTGSATIQLMPGIYILKVTDANTGESVSKRLSVIK